MNMSTYKPTAVKIGLEVHAQLSTSQKLYCDCPTNYMDAQPNTNICPICYGLPGNKPMPLNKKAVESAIEIADLLDSDVVRGEVRIMRKHYDYPDLPNGYQKTSTPIAVGGKFKGVRIRDMHIEDDPGRYELMKGEVDYNRSGVPLIEIVTEPDMKSAEQARDFWKELTESLMYTGLVRTEPGSIRADVNVSINGGTRVEIKNVNSSKGVQHALNYEIKRQEKAARRGREIHLETRGFLEDKMTTVALRSKETAEDYRYIPDPDIPPIVLTESWIEKILKNSKEPFKNVQNRLANVYAISLEQAALLASYPKARDIFESLPDYVNRKNAASWLTTEIRSISKKRGIGLENLYLDRPEVKTIIMASEHQPDKAIIRSALESVIVDKKAVDIESIKNYTTFKDERIYKVTNLIISENPQLVKEYKTGKSELFNYFVGAAMKRAGKGTDSKKVAEALKKALA